MPIQLTRPNNSTVLGDLVDTFDPSQTLIFDDPAIESHPVIRAVFALSRSEPVPYPVLCTIEANLPAIKEFIHKWDCPAVEAALPAALCLAERQRINKNQSIYMVSLEWRFNDCRDLVKEYGLEGLGFPTNKGAGGPACMHLPYVFLQRIPPVHAHALLAAHLAEVAGKTREQVVETYHHTIVNGLPGSPPRGWRS